MNQLQKILSANALFSGFSGLVLIIAAPTFASLFDLENASVFQWIGGGLLLFSGLIIYEIKRQKPLGVLSIILQDFLWVLGSLFLLITRPFDISETGNGLITLVAIIVLIFGIGQSKALAQIDNTPTKGLKQMRFERIVKASKSDVWKIIADVENYDLVAPNLDDVKILEGEGQGMVRSCSHGKDSWTETCTLWEEEKMYSFKVNTSAPDYPYPFQHLQGTWEVESISPDTSKVIMIFEFRYKRGFQNWLIHPILKGKFGKTAEELLDNWQAQMEG